MNISTKRPSRPRTGWLNAGKPEQKRASVDPAQAFRKAKARVGEDALDLLRWFLAFAQTPAEHLRSEFLKGPSGSRWYDVAVITGIQQREVSEESADRLCEVAHELAEGFRKLITDRAWRLPVGPVELVVEKEQGPGEARPQWRHRYEIGKGADFASALKMHAADALKTPEALDRLAECQRQGPDGPDCRRLFLRRKRGAFCSRRCSQIEQSRRWRASRTAEQLEKLSEDRHKRYVESLTLPPSIAERVPRRPRRQ